MNQFQEFLLQGSVLDSSVSLIHDRLKGLTNSSPVFLHEHELVMVQNDGSAPHALKQKLHVRRSADHNEAGEDPPPWLLRYVGMPEPNVARSLPVLVRKTVDCLAHSNDMMVFLGDIGFKMDYEFVVKGYIYMKGNIKITVQKILKITKRGDCGETEELGNSHYVEMSCVLPYGKEGTIAHDMQQLAEQLKPIVQMERIDYTRSTTSAFEPVFSKEDISHVINAPVNGQLSTGFVCKQCSVANPF